MVFTGGFWQTEGGEKKTEGGRGKGEKKIGGGGGGGGETCMLLEVQSCLVIHWLFITLTAYNTSCISI